MLTTSDDTCQSQPRRVHPLGEDVLQAKLKCAAACVDNAPTLGGPETMHGPSLRIQYSLIFDVTLIASLIPCSLRSTQPNNMLAIKGSQMGSSPMCHAGRSKQKLQLQMPERHSKTLRERSLTMNRSYCCTKILIRSTMHSKSLLLVFRCRYMTHLVYASR